MGTVKIAQAAPFSGAPRINLASAFGASPGKPLILRIPTTGQRPIRWEADGLPEGLRLQENVICGTVANAGNYPITLSAENASGKAEKQVMLEIAPNHVQIAPLLGFTTWNAFGSAVTQEDVENTAARLVELGISEYGYSYVNLDSGWQHSYGGKYDAIMPNSKFPDMKKMVDTVHSCGLKCGIYSTPMLQAWGCPAELPSIPGCTVGEPDLRFTDLNGGIGVIHKEQNNAKQWQEWGFDYLKYDWKPADPVNAELMRQALIASDRDFVYSITIKALKEYHGYWSNYCNSFRSGPDTHREWPNLLRTFQCWREFPQCRNRGHYYDMDMLDIGTCRCDTVRGDFTEDEQITEFSLRVMLRSPIQISSTLEHTQGFEQSVYCNEEILAIHQDLAAWPEMILEQHEEMVFAFRRPLEDGSCSYAVFNLGESEQNVALTFPEETQVRDVWAKQDLGKTARLQLQIPPHCTRIFKCANPEAAAAVQ